MTPLARARILLHFDLGKTPVQIAAALTLPPDAVWTVLRAERPGRKRAPRSRSSNVPARVLGLHEAGYEAALIKKMLGVSRQYVHSILKR